MLSAQFTGLRLCRSYRRVKLLHNGPGIEVKQKLSGVGLPACLAVPRDHSSIVGIYFHAGQMLIAGKLALQRQQHADNVFRWNAGVEETFGCLEKENILKRKLQRLLLAPAGLEKS